MKTTCMITLTFCALNCFGQHPEAMIQLMSTGEVVRWVHIDGDEFDGPSLDMEKWRNDYPWGRNFVGGTYGAYNTDGDNFIFQNGHLDIEIREQDILARGIGYESDTYTLLDGGPNLRTWEYTTGMVFSNRKYKYGLFEIEFKAPEGGSGMWPAFWLFAGNELDEIDVFELKGECPDKLHWDLHYNTADPGEELKDVKNVGGWLTTYDPTGTGQNLTNTYNTMRVEWASSFIWWSLNNTTFAVYDKKEYEHSMWLIANLATADHCASGEDNCTTDGDSFCGGFHPWTVLPNIYSINHIRVWKQINCDDIVDICDYYVGPVTESAQTGRIINVDPSPGCRTVIADDQWFDLVATDAIEINPGFEVGAGGVFEAKVLGCFNFSTSAEVAEFGAHTGTLETSNVVTRSEEIESADSITQVLATIYPNPASNQVEIQLGENVTEVIVQLMDGTGNLIDDFSSLKQGLEKFTVDLTGYSAGIYFVVLTIDGKSHVEKLVVQ